MFDYIEFNKLRDKLLLATISFIVFGCLYMTAEKKEVPFDNSDVVKSMLFSFGTQVFKFDIFNVSGKALYFVILQAIISYVILLM